MTDQKPAGVFVRLPLSDEQKDAVYDLASKGGASDAILAIGTPVTGGDIPIAGLIAPKQAEKAILGTASPMTLQPRGSGGKRYTVALIRQSDAQAQIAALEAEVVRLWGVLSEIAESDDTENALDPERNKRFARVALKGGAA